VQGECNAINERAVANETSKENVHVYHVMSNVAVKYAGADKSAIQNRLTNEPDSYQVYSVVDENLTPQQFNLN